MSAVTLRCPWDAPPIRSNQRLHWAAKAKLTKRVRADGATVARQWMAERPHLMAEATPPGVERCAITLVWTVTDRRRRDVGAAGPTLKAWIDGMVDAGLIARDSHDVVAEERLRIEVGSYKHVRVEIDPIERKDTTT